MPLTAITDERILAEVVGRVDAVDALGEDLFAARIALAVETLDGSIGQLLNMLVGNSSFHSDALLVDFDLPDEVLDAYCGPAHGIAGLRRLADAPRRPLTLANLKPQGLSPDDLADLAYRLAIGGLDFVKDDHGLADQRSAPFAERVAAVAAAVSRAGDKTGVATRYLPNVTGDLDALRRQLDIVRANGLAGVLIAPLLVGLPAFLRLTRDNPDLLFMAHPAFAGRSPLGFAPLLGKLLRLCGADAVVFPMHESRFAIPPVDCRRLADFARQPWGTLAPTLPVPAGGVRFDGLGRLIDFYGEEIMVFLGGSLLASGERLSEDSRRFVAAVHAWGRPADPGRV